MKKTWVITADHTRARIFTMESPLRPLRELTDLFHAEGGLLDQEKHSDRPGTTYDSHGAGRHSMEPRTDLRHLETDRFASQICTHLQKGLADKKCDGLIILADPSVLGSIRKHLSPQLRKILKGTVNKNVVGLNEKMIRMKYIRRS